MPTVGKMKFPYSKKGIEDAKNYAKQSGKPMKVEGNYMGGGKVMPKYRGGGMVLPAENISLANLLRPSMPQYGDIHATESPMYRKMRSDAIKRALMERKAREDSLKKMILAKRISDMINQKGKTPSKVRKKKK